MFKIKLQEVWTQVRVRQNLREMAELMALHEANLQELRLLDNFETRQNLRLMVLHEAKLQELRLFLDNFEKETTADYQKLVADGVVTQLEVTAVLPNILGQIAEGRELVTKIEVALSVV